MTGQQKADFSQLQNLLTSEQGFNSFLAFLTKEFSTENLLCWRDLHEWNILAETLLSAQASPPSTPSINSRGPLRNTLSKADLLKRALGLFADYFDPSGAPYSVNISATDRQHIDAAVSAFSEKISTFSAYTPTSASHSFYLQPTSTTVSTNSEPCELDGKKDEEFTALFEALKAAEHSLFELMNSDSFLRFKTTEAYQELKNKLELTSKLDYTTGYSNIESLSVARELIELPNA